MNLKARKPAVRQPTNRGQSATFWIEPEEHRKLRTFAAEHGLSVSNVINRAIKRYLEDFDPFANH